MTREQRRQLWLKRLREMEKSGLTQKAWCESKGISYSTFRYWSDQLAESADKRAFEAGISVRYDDFLLTFSKQCDMQTVQVVMQALKDLGF